MITKNPLKLVQTYRAPQRVTPKPPLVLRKVHLDILRALFELGFERASQFDEDALDELFKQRPRLVCLLKGHVQATVDITSEGIAAYTKATRS